MPKFQKINKNGMLTTTEAVALVGVSKPTFFKFVQNAGIEPRNITCPGKRGRGFKFLWVQEELLNAINAAK